MISETTKRFIECLSKLKKSGKLRSFAKFAEDSNFRKQSLNEILKERREVPSHLLSLLVEKYDVSAEYLLSGHGDAIFQNDKAPAISDNIIMVAEDQVHAYIQWIKTEHSAIPFPVFSIPEVTSKRKKYVFLETGKSSIAPSEMKGEYLLCTSIETNQLRFSVTSGEHYVVLTSKELVAGRVINQLRNDQLLIIQIDQNKNNDIKFKFSEIIQVLKIEFVIQSIGTMKEISKDIETWNQSIKLLEKQMRQSNEKLDKISTALKIQ
jgi:hypothetical protein